jgi:uncharacterized membrane protein YfcA
MEIVIISIVALVTSLLTFFSGFGLGTLLMPVFAIFFPLDQAIAMTGVVHFSNNIFKGTLVWKNTDKEVLLKFGIPAIIASFAGAWLLLSITHLPVLETYTIGSRSFSITPVKLIISVLLLFFAITELLPFFEKLSFSKKKLVLGGILSGFFGGLTGIQGALRSAFLIKAGLSKESYIATGVMIACVVDITRLSVYASNFVTSGIAQNLTVLIIATMAAIAGAILGNRLLKKVTISTVKYIVAIMLIFISFALGSGLI